MGNSLEGVGSESPPPPNPDAGNALQQGAPAQQGPSAPPNHAQTVAALRHFDAIKDELQVLLNNPTLGKADVKSQIIDGVSNLVSKRFLSPAQAVIQLSQVPDNPLDQRKWLQTQLIQTVNAERAILAHHAMGFAGQGPEPAPSADDHMGTMAALQSNYGGGK